MGLLSFIFNKKSTSSKIDNSDSGTELLKKADYFIANSEYYDALPFLDKAIKLGCDEAYVSRALCLQALGFILDSIDDFTKAISIKPNDCNLYFCRGNSLIELKSYDLANKDGEKAIILAKENLPENIRYNDAAKTQGYDSAKALYESMIMAWRIGQDDPKIQKIKQDLFNRKLNSTNPEDIAYVRREQIKNEKLFKRRNIAE